MRENTVMVNGKQVDIYTIGFSPMVDGTQIASNRGTVSMTPQIGLIFLRITVMPLVYMSFIFMDLLDIF